SIIDSYYNQFSSIRSFMDDCIKNARNNGYVSTLFGRKRFISDLDSPNRQLQGNAERIAINTTVQGSAADIIKRAMNLISVEMAAFQSHLIMQVHDELVFDVHTNELLPIKSMVVEQMESSVSLAVPLVVDVEVGKNWGRVA
ncbi:MAG: DNA polymerase, partial [Candidatus Margulisiibacteriota bacterium]